MHKVTDIYNIGDIIEILHYIREKFFKILIKYCTDYICYLSTIRGIKLIAKSG